MDFLDYKFYSLSEKGRRSRNEDAVLSLKLDENTLFFAVADGMGGAKGGDIASKLVLQKTRERLEELSEKKAITTDNLKEVLGGVFSFAQQSVRQFLETHEDYKGMGTTLTTLLIHRDRYVWGNIGDSRLYIIQKSNTSRATIDHNMLEDSSEDALLDKSLTLPPQYYHSLTRVIDGGDSQPDIFPEDASNYKVENNDYWVLCSDGLIVDKKQPVEQLLTDFIKKYTNLQSLARQLAANAFQNGSSDNISLIVIKAVQEHYNPGAPTQRIVLPRKSPAKKSRKKSSAIILLSIFLLVLAGVIWYFNLFGIAGQYMLKKNQERSVAAISKIIGQFYANQLPLIRGGDFEIDHLPDNLFFAASISLFSKEDTLILFPGKMKEKTFEERFLQKDEHTRVPFNKIKNKHRLGDSLIVETVFYGGFSDGSNEKEWLSASGIFSVLRFLSLLSGEIRDESYGERLEEFGGQLGLELLPIRKEEINPGKGYYSGSYARVKQGFFFENKSKVYMHLPGTNIKMGMDYYFPRFIKGKKKNNNLK